MGNEQIKSQRDERSRKNKGLVNLVFLIFLKLTLFSLSLNLKNEINFFIKEFKVLLKIILFLILTRPTYEEFWIIFEVELCISRDLLLFLIRLT